MVKFVLFLKKVYIFVLFIVLEALALNFYANSTNYTKAKLLTISNSIAGKAYDVISSVEGYFYLRRENTILSEELVRVRGELSAYKEAEHTRQIDTLPAPLVDESSYVFSTARVVNNSITRQENFFTLNKGRREGVVPGMAVLSLDGVAIGYVLSCSEKFSVCISILNVNFRTSGKIKNSDYFGSIYWDGVNNEYITITEMSKYAGIEKGDTIVTSNYSSIFPPDILFGTVESIELSENAAYYDVRVKLGTHMSAINNVFLVKFKDAVEQVLVEAETIRENSTSAHVPTPEETGFTGEDMEIGPLPGN